MSNAPGWIAPTLFGLSSLSGALIGLPPGWWKLIPVVVLVVAFLAAGAILHARERKEANEIQRRDEWIAQAEAEYKATMSTLLGDNLHNMLYMVAEAVSTPDAGARRRAARLARQTIICGAANLVGAKAAGGTRANLFRLDVTTGSPKMELEPGAFFGRGDMSGRRFAEDDETMKDTLANKARFIESVSEQCDGDESLLYETFLTHPVSVGPSVIHGALMVDCLKTGDLEEDIDRPLMAVLADLIAITYECEKYPNPRKANGSRVT